MSLEQAILDRLEKRNAQIEMLQQTIQAMSRAADAEREHARQQLAPLIEENKKLAAQIDSDEKITRSNYEHMERQIAALRGECEQMRREVPLESTREGLKNAVAKLQEVTTEKDRMRLQLENARADIKQAMVELDSLGSMAADRATEIHKLMDGHAEDMKAQAELTAQLDSAKGEAEEWLKQCHVARRQRDEVKAEARKETQRLSDLCAELQSKYESILTKTTDLGSYAMTLGRKEGEPLEMFMERQALRLAALEAAITAAKCDELAKATARIKPLEALYKTLKGWQENDHIIGYGLTIDTAINKATEALSQLTA